METVFVNLLQNKQLLRASVNHIPIISKFQVFFFFLFDNYNVQVLFPHCGTANYSYVGMKIVWWSSITEHKKMIRAQKKLTD